MSRPIQRTSIARWGALAAAAALSLGTVPAQADTGVDTAVAPLRFKMVRSPGVVAAGCVPYATASVKITPSGDAEVMDISVQGLPAYTGFDLFLTQVPNPPFGMSWYQSDLQTDAWGKGSVRVIGRFNQETFIIAPGTAPAPVKHEGDAESNPPMAPLHTYHLGLWFNSPVDAGAAGCPDFTTPFNGEHNAGIQVLNTSNYPDLAGPLQKVKP